MQSLSNLKRNSWTALAVTGCLVAFAGSASANSVTLSQSGGPLGPSTYSISSTFTVTVFANLSDVGGGQEGVRVDLGFDSAVLTADACHEFAEGTYLLGTSPSPTFGQVVGGVGVYAPYTPNCGYGGNPGDGGVSVPGGVGLIEQWLRVGVAASSGSLIIGTVTFHSTGIGTSNVLVPITFVYADGVSGGTIVDLGGLLTVNVVPEPDALVLLVSGVVGLVAIGRSRIRP